MNNKKSNLVLIGMPGCGKSTVGKIVSKEIKYNFCDMDTFIETISKSTIKDLFKDGEENFRNWETKACRELSKKFIKTVIASGGGVVKKQINIDILKENAIIIFIDRNVEDILSDVDTDSRPLLKDGKEKLYTLYKERYELYKNAADVYIKNEGSVKDVVNKIVKAIK